LFCWAAGAIGCGWRKRKPLAGPGVGPQSPAKGQVALRTEPTFGLRLLTRTFARLARSTPADACSTRACCSDRSAWFSSRSCSLIDERGVVAQVVEKRRELGVPPCSIRTESRRARGTHEQGDARLQSQPMFAAVNFEGDRNSSRNFDRRINRRARFRLRLCHLAAAAAPKKLPRRERLCVRQTSGASYRACQFEACGRGLVQGWGAIRR
jgi:hypothetical protein